MNREEPVGLPNDVVKNKEKVANNKVCAIFWGE